jgi:hypothetical protein
VSAASGSFVTVEAARGLGLRGRRGLVLILMLAALVRVPFWAEALRTPLDGDAAVLGLMAKHPLSSVTMWGQPYGSPVEAWLVAPFVAVLGLRAEAVRLAHALLGLALVPLAWALAHVLDRRAALPAALVMACPPPYFLLLASMPPPMYPTALALSGLLLVAALRYEVAIPAPGRLPPSGWLVLWGVASGLAVWTHLMTAGAVAASAVFLLRRAGWRRLLLYGLAPLLVACSPWLLHALSEGGALRVVELDSRRASALEHFEQVAPEIHRPLGAVLGTHVPVVADEPESMVPAPRWVAAGLVLTYGFGLVFAIRFAGLRGSTGLLLAVVLLTLVAFPWPARSHPAAVRFMTPLYLPLVALVIWMPAGRFGGRRPWVLALLLACLHLVAASRLLDAWRGSDRRRPPFSLVDLGPAREQLEAHGVSRAYASYATAYRLTFESGERVVASQPWNERFLHHSLPLLDEVRFATRVGWVLTPTVPTGLPSPAEFEAELARAGGRYRRTEAGEAVVFHGFAPPFGPAVRPWPGGGAVGDGDPRTSAPFSGPSPQTFVLETAVAAEALTLVAPPAGPSLLRSMDVEVSSDGQDFETVTGRRRRGERDDLRWVGGHPQYVIGNDVLAVPLGRRMVRAVRVRPVASDEPWALAELLVHPPGAAGAWTDTLDSRLSWRERREALLASPQPDRADWYWRLFLALRH